MSRQSRRAAAGSRIMAARWMRPRRMGSSHAPMMSRSPGCTHSRVIVVLAAHQPQLADQFRDNDDRNARDKAVDRAPSRELFESEVGFAAVEDAGENGFSKRDCNQDGVRQQLETTA